MSAMLVISCPQCQKKLKAPAELAGKKVRCKDCGATFAVKPAAAKESGKPPANAAARSAAKTPQQAAKESGDILGFKEESAPSSASPKAAPKPSPSKDAAKKAVDDEFQDSKPYAVTELDDTPRCPNCAKELGSEDDVICLHCGYNNRTRQHMKPVRTFAITGADRFEWLLPGILCVVLILVLIGIDCFICFGMSSAWKYMDEETGVTSLSRAIRTFTVVFSAWVAWQAAKFAHKRLVVNPNPPEVEKK